MNKSIWIFQFPKEVRQKGADLASWYVGWYDLDGKRHSESCGPGSRGLNQAEKRKRRIQSELDIGVHKPASRKKGSEFVAEYEEKILNGLAPKSKLEAKQSLTNFDRIAKPSRVDGIKTQTIDDFIAYRRKCPGKKRKSLLSPATINKDLRHVKAALRVAREWSYITEVPKIRMVREPKKLPVFVTVEHFDLIYHKACPLAKLPAVADASYSAKDWWQALVTTAYMTGLRIHEILSIRRDDLDLQNGVLVSRWGDNKGKRDEPFPIHPVVVKHLKRLGGDTPLVFLWPHDPRTLWSSSGEFRRKPGSSFPAPTSTSTPRAATSTASTISGGPSRPLIPGVGHRRSCSRRCGTRAFRRPSGTFTGVTLSTTRSRA